MAELLTGESSGISAYEFSIWPLYFEVKADLQREAQKKAEKAR